MSDPIKTVNPKDGSVLAEYPRHTDFEMQRAIEAAHAAFLDWRMVSLSQRADVIRGLGAALERNKDDLARLMTNEMGKLLTQSYQEIELCSAICQWTADKGPAHLAPEEREVASGDKGLVAHAPIGLVYGIQPWNYPAYQVIRYAVANLMAGNGVLLKHAANVTGTGLKIEQIFEEAGLPSRLFTVLKIDHNQSAKVIEHDLVRGVTLTGSTDAGRIVAEQAGKVVKKTVLELGSNDAYVILSDADLPKAVETCVQGRIYNNGETCIAAKRFIVVDALYDAFKTEFVRAMEALTVGDPTQAGVDLGPLARHDLRDTLHEQVEESVAKGAKVLCGGKLIGADGAYYPPTVLDNVKPGMPAYDDELFGPVASLIRAKNDADAMRIANDSRFGLGGGIFSQDTDRAIELARDHFDTGMVFINSFGLADPGMPFGGVKESGFGREHGGFGMREFTNAKAIFVGA